MFFCSVFCFSFGPLVCVLVSLFVARLRKQLFSTPKMGIFAFFSVSLSLFLSFFLHSPFSVSLSIFLPLFSCFLSSFLPSFLLFYPSFFIAFNLSSMMFLAWFLFFCFMRKQVENMKLARFPLSIIDPVNLFGFLFNCILQIHSSYLLEHYHRFCFCES